MSEQNNNPANEIAGIPSDYRPMNEASLKLEIPSKDGWHRHWFRGTADRIARAQQAGYRFVDRGEVNVNSFDLAGDGKDGNTDLGTRVSVISGDDIDRSGQPGRLYLMECPKELFERSQKIVEERNDDVAAALRGNKITGGSGETAVDFDKRYMKGSTPSLFIKSKSS